MSDNELVGAVVCKIDPHKRTFRNRGYIGMLAVDHTHRRKRIGKLQPHFSETLHCNLTAKPSLRLSDRYDPAEEELKDVTLIIDLLM